MNIACFALSHATARTDSFVYYDEEMIFKSNIIIYFFLVLNNNQRSGNSGVDKTRQNCIGETI